MKLKLITDCHATFSGARWEDIILERTVGTHFSAFCGPGNPGDTMKFKFPNTTNLGGHLT